MIQETFPCCITCDVGVAVVELLALRIELVMTDEAFSNAQSAKGHDGPGEEVARQPHTRYVLIGMVN